MRVQYDRKKRIIGEPTFNSKMTPEEVNRTMKNCLNFYASDANKKALKKDLFAYLKTITHGIDSKTLTRLSLNFHIIPFTAFKLARMVAIGMPPNERIESEILSMVKDSIKNLPAEVKEPENTAPKVSPLDRLKEKVETSIIVELEDMLDTWMEDKTTKAEGIDLALRLKQYSIPHKGYPIIRAWITKFLNELNEAYEQPDSDMAEAYSHLDRSVLKRWRTVMNHLNNTLDYQESLLIKKKEKVKIRKRKPKNQFQLLKQLKKKISHIKYQEEDKDLKIKSVPLEDVVGARSIWAYNTKYGVLIYWMAQGPEGLDVRGTTFQNFNEKLSFRTKLRKPEEILRLFDDPKVTNHRVEKAVQNLTTKKHATNGRSNDCTVILKIYK